MTVPLPVGPLTPYLTPELLVTAPTGISWSTIPPGSQVTSAQRYAEQLNMCMRATSEIDGYCNMVMRATVDTEFREGPNYYLTIQSNGPGNARIILFRKPILNINSVQVSPNTFPRQYVTVPAGMYAVEYPGIGFYGTNAPSSASESGQSIIVSAGFVDWRLGRNGYVVQVQYVNGYPHTSLTQNVAAGTTTLPVDDCTGWAPFGTSASTQSNSQFGSTGVVFDSGAQEVVQVTAASATTGPGNLTIQSPTQFPHQAGVLMSAMPAAIQQAAIYLCSAYALTRGATSTTIHQIPGGSGGSGGDVNSPSALIKRAWHLLDPFKRII